MQPAIPSPWQSIHAQLVDELGRAICAGHPAPGETLPTEPALLARYGVSRVLLREAIRSLSAKGLLEARPRIGTRVRPRQDWNLLDPQVIGWITAAVPDLATLEALLELRRAIEPASVRLAARRADANDNAAIADAYHAMAAAIGDAAGYREADQRFHRAVLAACHNDFLWQMQPALSVILDAALRVAGRPQRHAVSLPCHREVMDGIARGDPARAGAAIERLIDLAEADLQASLDRERHDHKKPA